MGDLTEVLPDDPTVVVEALQAWADEGISDPVLPLPEDENGNADGYRIGDDGQLMLVKNVLVGEGIWEAPDGNDG